MPDSFQSSQKDVFVIRIPYIAIALMTLYVICLLGYELPFVNLILLCGKPVFCYYFFLSLFSIYLTILCLQEKDVSRYVWLLNLHFPGPGLKYVLTVKSSVKRDEQGSMLASRTYVGEEPNVLLDKFYFTKDNVRVHCIGYLVGSFWNRKGNGANFLCATQKPQFGRAVAGYQDGSGRYVGVEFEIKPAFSSIFKTDNVGGQSLENQDMVCARCHGPNSSDVFVLPGRLDCQDSGYKLMYKGYMVAEAEYGDRQAHEYICLDEAPDGRAGGSGNDDQGVIYSIQAECNSLPCNPYVNGLEMTCAVCGY